MHQLCFSPIIIDTFHNQVATYTGGSHLEWREVESGNLPSIQSIEAWIEVEKSQRPSMAFEYCYALYLICYSIQ